MSGSSLCVGVAIPKGFDGARSSEQIRLLSKVKMSLLFRIKIGLQGVATPTTSRATWSKLDRMIQE